MNIDNFIALERERIADERARLSARSSSVSAQQIEQCPAVELLASPNANIGNCKRRQIAENVTNAGVVIGVQDGDSAMTTQSAINSAREQQETGADTTFSLYMHQQPEQALENAPSDTKENDLAELQAHLSKAAKDWANQKETQSNKGQTRANAAGKKTTSNAKKDDMEQWVTDTFYSYFPGYNNELQKRQNYLRERQQEYQQNLLKHQQQMLQDQKREKERAHRLNKQTEDVDAEMRNLKQQQQKTNRTNDKTDLEIINVFNPNYDASKYSARPGSTRHKLLQDLQHTELSNIVGGEGVTERNRRNEELAQARKKDYQRELMAQIEEKQRAIELLREKERRQDESLTRRLQEQLRTIELEERLERERVRAEKLKFEAAQNRLMREQLLAKLKQDDEHLMRTKQGKHKNVKHQATALDDTSTPTSTSSNANEQNKVYQYFSNSARHEYRRGRKMPAELELDLSIPERTKIERECFHMCDKICPHCDEPLKSYESSCLRCQRRLSLKIASKQAKQGADNAQDGDVQQTQEATAENDQGNNANDAEQMVSGHGSFALVCHKCERLYALCPTCMAKSDVCRACHRKRNVCMNCRRTLCTFCLEEIACGKDTERQHINDQNEKQRVLPVKNDANSLRSFEVLELQRAEAEANESPCNTNMTCSTPISAPSGKQKIHNNLNEVAAQPPYSLNISPTSVFHPDYKLPEYKPNLYHEQNTSKLSEKDVSFDLPVAAATSTFDFVDDANIERVRKETERRLTRYMKNYGDLAKQSARSKSETRSTQTTPDTMARRDVVLQDANNLSMPLLREMPKMTRKEQNNFTEQHQQQQTLNNITGAQRKIDNLKRRWEVPAVQKYSITPNSPRVLTQVGAIRKQLQADYLFSDDTY